MATFEQRRSIDGKITYRVKIRLRGQKAVSGTFERKSDAKRWAAETETGIRNGKYFERREAQKHTVGQLIEKYCNEVLPLKRNSTRYCQEFQLAWWKEQIGDRFLSDVTPALLTECRGRLKTSEKGVRSPTTVKRYLAALSHAFTVAMKDWQWIQANPFRLITIPKEPRGRVRYLSESERSALFEACAEISPQLYAIALLAISTGARKGEIMGLRWDDVNLKLGAATFHDTKNDDRRSVPIRGKALEVLRRLPRRIDSDFVFPHVDGIRPMRIRKDWEAAVVAAKLKDFRFHDLRHCCASYLAMSGATSGEIAAVLGHKTLAMVKRYAHIGEQHTAGVLERMHAKVLGGMK